MRILVVEDNQKLSRYIKKALERESYAVDCLYDGETAEKRVAFGEYDLVVLDVLLPKKDGISVCRDLREKNINVPIIMLTALGEVNNKIEGLDSGADDYLVKPFDLAELLARIRALLRRPTGKVMEVLQVQDIMVNNALHQAKQADVELKLTLKEYCVLEYLMRNAGQTVTREQILEHCWDFAFDSFSNIVDVYVKQLRKKLDDTDERYIRTIRSVGYQFQR